jgi:hypothetical protein
LKNLQSGIQIPTGSDNRVKRARITNSLFVYINKLRVAVSHTLVAFSKGNSMKRRILQKLGIETDCLALKTVCTLGKERIRNTERPLKLLEIYTKGRLQNEMNEERDDPPHEAERP